MILDNIKNKDIVTFKVKKELAYAYIWPYNTYVSYGYDTVCNITGKIITIYHDSLNIEYVYNYHYQTYYPI